MESDTKKWLKQYGEKVLKEVGITKNQNIVDFGCGSGYYTIPAAQIVGNKGKVYALDKDRVCLNEVAKSAQSRKLENIQIIATSGELKIPLEDESVDVVLLYDVIHSYYFSPATRKELLREVHRISNHNALVSVYPRHMDLQDAQHIIENANFSFERKLFETLLHDNSLVQDYLLNFRREGGPYSKDLSKT